MPVSQTELQRRLSRLQEACRQAGLKVTHQRREIFSEVAASDEHPDAESIYQQVAGRVTGISRDTVYRTLATLEDCGLICKTGAMGGPARFDANTEQHHHFICTRCGMIKDFQSEELDGLPIPRSVRELGSIETAQVQVRGVCSRCRQRQKE